MAIQALHLSTRDPRPSRSYSPTRLVWPNPEVEDGLVWPDHWWQNPELWMTVDTVHWDGISLIERFAEHRRMCELVSVIGSGQGRMLVTEVPFDVDGWSTGTSGHSGE